ncbi:MAG: c-type cytochrome [Deltaproteobacteria bacterium]|nr:MAG: c-type cytochrome [Deltaproteobacteria bacterium]
MKLMNKNFITIAKNLRKSSTEAEKILSPSPNPSHKGRGTPSCLADKSCLKPVEEIIKYSHLSIKASLLIFSIILLSTQLAFGEEKKVSLGEKIYRRHCLSCHGEGGRGGQPNIGVKNPADALIPPLNTGAMKIALTTDEFGEVFNRKTIREKLLKGSKVEGTVNTVSMPAFAEKLKAKEIEALLNWIPELASQRPVRYRSERIVFLGVAWALIGLISMGLVVVRRMSIAETGEIPRLPVDNLYRNQLLELDACVSCGECLNYCPVYQHDEREDIIPRAKINTSKELIASQHSPLADLFGYSAGDPGQIGELSRNLYECSVCGQCHIVCPSGIDTIELWESLRASFVRAGSGPLEGHMGMINSIKSNDNPWEQPRSRRAKWAERALRKKLLSRGVKDLSKEKAEVLYYVGCTASFDVNIQEVAINTAELLNRLNIDYGILGVEEVCCGSVLQRVGHPEYSRLARGNLDRFNSMGIKTIITSCSGCYRTIKLNYPELGELKFEILHLVEFLVRMLEEGKLKFTKELPLKVTYHDPCHLGRHNDLYDEPRKILRSLPGVELIEMERSREYSRCCGAGGGLKAGYTEIQAKMAVLRVEDAEATGADTLVSACPFCQQALKTAIIQTNSSLVMRDITELVNMAL